jgi:hypothetical protein
MKHTVKLIEDVFREARAAALRTEDVTFFQPLARLAPALQ